MTAESRLAQESFEMLMDLADTGDLAQHGFPSSIERFEKLVRVIACEAVSILHDELATLSVEQRGKTGIRKVQGFVQLAQRLGIELPAGPFSPR
jgi:hypothetical protein